MAPADSSVELNGASRLLWELGSPLQQANYASGGGRKGGIRAPAPREMSPPLFPRLCSRGIEKPLPPATWQG
jgi:hypothetical protein